MRNLIWKVFQFIVLFFLIFVFANFAFFGMVLITDWDWKKRVEAIRFEDPSFELLVLGSSLPEYGIDTGFMSEQGISSYNLAILGNNVRTSYIQLNEYISLYQKKPKYVLLALNSEMESTDGLTIHPMVEYTMEGYRYRFDDFPLFKFSKWFGGELLKKMLSKNHRNAEVVLGQIRRHKSTPDTTSYKEQHIDLSEFETSFWMGEIARLCTDNNIVFLIVELPGVREFQNISDYGPYTLNFRNGQSALLYNFNSQDFCKIIDPKNDWVGDSHLNPGGAIKFTKELTHIIK